MAKLIRMLSQGIIVVGVAIGSASFFGCASSASPSPERSTNEIKRDADRSFEKMKQEEREYRGEGGSPPR